MHSHSKLQAYWKIIGKYRINEVWIMHSQISEIMKNRDSDDKGSTVRINFFSLYYE